ncbi:ABC transporter substrate-binding protein [Minwuia sp.]|uniref:ABC transporter substrate-binding protein n=1 Tax=Minwuia sp. TaxID=2493630 RepID=UPI003A91CA0F
MRRALAGLILAASAMISPAAFAGKHAPQQCEIDRPIVIAGLNWDSNAFHAALASRILRDGFGCRVEIATGSTRPLFKAMTRGDVDITMEVWKDNLPKLWPEAMRTGSVVELGVNYPDAIQGWFIPAYLTQGPDAPAPDLRAVSDLPAHKSLFADPEDRRKGRFYNCMLGWGCEPINTAKLQAYGLDAHFTNFRPASGKALIKAIDRHYERREPFLTYYWGPTWVLGAYDLVMLEEPAYDPVVWQRLTRDRNPEKATAYPTSEITIAVHKAFHEQAPALVSFLSRYRTNNALISEALADMNRSGRGADAAAAQFLKSREDIWTDWVPAETADRIRSALR